MNTKQSKKLSQNYNNENEIIFLNKDYIINNHYYYLNDNEIKEIYNLIENEIKKENDLYNIYDLIYRLFYININSIINNYICKLLEYHKNIELTYKTDNLYNYECNYYNIQFEKILNKQDLKCIEYKIIEYILIYLDIKLYDLKRLYKAIINYFYKNYSNIPIDYYKTYSNKMDMIKHIIKIIFYETDLLQLFINEIYIYI